MMKAIHPAWRTLIALTFALLTTAALAGQELPGSIRGFKKETLEVYFNRADQERESSAWEQVARFGAESAISQWEREAADLYTDPDETAVARTQLATWVGGQVQERYESWLTRRFFGRQGSLGSEAVLLAIRDADLQYLYTTDDAGNIVLDERGDPVLRGANGVDADRAGWRAHVASATEEVLAAWESRVDSAFAPELGGLLGTEALARYGEYKGSLEAGLRREMERVALQGELSLTARRLYDQYSLRKKSESSTADAVAEQIVRETRAQTDEGIQQIKAGLALTPDSVDSSTSPIYVDTWMESFKAALDSGLSKWDTAEERFLAGRLEWERDAGKSYSEGEKAWSAAFQRLQTERRSWEREVEALLESGSARWEQSRGELAAAIEGARTEFQKERDERIGGMQDRVGALVDMYAQSLQVISTAAASGQELVRKLGIRSASGEYVKFSGDEVPVIAEFRRQKWAEYVGKVDGLISGLNAQIASYQADAARYYSLAAFFINMYHYNPYAGAQAGLTAQIAGSMSKIAALSNLRAQLLLVDAGGPVQGSNPAQTQALQAYMDMLKQADGNSSAADAVQADWERLARMGDWLTMIDTYTEQAASARQGLQSALGSAFGSYATDLRDVLKENAETGVAYLDEYQLELLRAKAVQDYWSQRKAIADAVVEYARDLSSGRQTEDESQKAYSAARASYEAQLAAYNTLLSLVRTGGSDLADARQALESAQRAVEDASVQYEAARQEYFQALAATQSGTVTFYQGQIEQKYRELLDASGMSGTDTELQDAAIDYFVAARGYGYDLATQSAWARAAPMAQGDPESGVASLASLKAAAQGIRVPASADSIPVRMEDLGVSVDSADFVRVSALYSAWRDAQGDEKRLAGWKLVKLLGILSVDAKSAWSQRLALVKAYGALDADAWYTQGGGRRAGGSLADRLSTDVTAAQFALIAARADAEKGGLEAWLQLQSGQTPTDQEGLMLARSASSGMTEADALDRLAGLQTLRRALQGYELDMNGAAERLREAARSGGWIQAFASGQGTFVDEQAGDLTLAVCAGQYEEVARANGVASAWQEAASVSTALVAERESAALNAIRGVFAGQGLAMTAAGVLPSAEDIAIAIKARSAADAAGFVSALAQELQSAASSGPRWLADRIGEYCGTLMGYAAAEAVRGGFAAGAAGRASAAEAAASALTTSQGGIMDLAQGLQGPARLASLIALSGRGDSPSAASAAARNLIVEAAAIQTAKRSLASPEQPLLDIALNLVAGVSPDLARDAAQRASVLLAANAHTGPAGERIAAYRVWNSVGVTEAVVGIAINPQAAEAKVLWDEVASKTWQDPQALQEAIDTYLSKFDAANPAPQGILLLCEQLDAGLESPEALFRQFLFGDDFDMLLASFDEMGPAEEVYKRALALTVAARMEDSTRGRALAGFLRDRSGIGSAPDAESFAGQTFDLAAAAFSGAGDLALEYLCKTLLYQGLALPFEAASRLSANPSTRDEVNAFRDQLRRVRGFIPALDGEARSYALSLGGDLQAQSMLAASVAAGQWDDELFAARAEGDYLGWYQGVSDSALEAASRIILDELGSRSRLLGEQAAQRSIEASYWRQVQRQAGQELSWRSYLAEANVGAAVTIAGAPSTETRDSSGYVRMSSDPAANVVLEAFSQVVRQEKATTDQLASTAGDMGSLAAFHSFLEAYAAGAVPETDLPEPEEQGLDSAEGAWRSALARMQALKDDILRSGQALAFLDLGATQRQQQLDQLKQTMDSFGAAVADRQATADSALAVFQSHGDSYNALYDQLQAGQGALEQSRFALRIQEEICDWASNGYLASGGEGAETYLSPSQAQTEASQRLVRATAALDALKELYGSQTVTERPLRDPATLAAYDAWKASYAQQLRMDRAVGELEEASSDQARKVEEKYISLQQAREEVLKWQEADGALGTSWESDASERAGNWASYLTLKDGRLALNVSSDFRLQTQSTEAEWKSVKDFFEEHPASADDSPEAEPKSAFERQMETWVTTVDVLAKQLGGMDRLINRWGLAADYLKRRMYDSNTGSEIQGLLDAYRSDDMFIYKLSLLDLKTNDGDYSGIVRDCINAAVASAQYSYGQVTSTSEERSAFELYLSMSVSAGDTGRLQQFNSRTTYLALKNFSNKLNGRIDELDDDWWQVFLSWFGGGKIPQLKGIKSEVDNTIGGFSGTTGGTLRSSIASFASAKASYESSCAQLAGLSGTNGAAVESVDAFLSQYKAVIAQGQGIVPEKVAVPSDLVTSFRSAWTRLGSEDKASFGKALRKIAGLANADADETRRTALLSAQDARQDHLAAQQAYQAEYQAFLAGTASEASLDAAARAAFVSSPWVAKEEQQLSTGILDHVSFSAESLMNAAETSARIEVVQKYAQSIVAAYAAALDTRGSALEQDWNQSVQDHGDRRQSWYAQVGLIRAKAASSWDTSQQKLSASLVQWEQSFQQEYSAKSEAWRMAYLNLADQKLEWVQEVQGKAAKAGNEAILSEVGASADDAARSASTLMIASMSFDPREASLRVEGLLGSVGGAQALAGLRRMNAGIAMGQVVVANGRLGVDTSGARIAAEARRFVQASRTELAALAARGIADEAQQAVEEAKKALAESVKQANEGFEGSMDETFVGEGYARGGGEYRRESIVRSTLFSSAKTETQRVSSYRWYAMPALELKVELSSSRLSGLEAQAVMDLVGVAQAEVGSAQKRIFGEGKKLTDEQKKTAGLMFEFSANDETVKRELGQGEFGEHIGYTPEFTNEPNFDEGRDRNIVVQGTGELGRLMGDFIWNQMKESRGWAEMGLPVWDKPLWDDTGSWLKAPNLRTVGTIAAGIAAAVIVPGGGAVTLGGILASAAISTSATVLFDGLDVAYGYKSFEEAGLDIGKTFLTSTVTSAVGGMFNGFNPLKEGASGFWDTGLSGVLGTGKSVAGKALLAGAQSFTTNVASSAINAVNWNSGGYLEFNNEAFNEGAFGKNAWASVAGAAGAAGMSTAFGNWNLYDGNDIALNGSVFNRKSIESFNGLMGSLTSAGIQYGMTGEATLNVMNVADFGNTASYGMMEMHLGGSRGFGMNLGSNGTNVSYSTIAASMSGLSDTLKITGAKANAAAGDLRGLSTLNAINMMGYTDVDSNITTARDVWSNRLKVRYDTIAGDNGYYNRDNPNEVVISNAFLGAGRDEAAKLATVLSHEGTHYSGNRVEGVAHRTGLQTYGELTSMFGMTGDQGFAKSMVAEILSVGSWTANTGSTDNWKLRRDGTVAYDGRANLYAEDGDNNDNNDELLTKTKSKGLEGSLLEILLGGKAATSDDIAKVRLLMSQSGLLHSDAANSDNWYWGGKENGTLRTGTQKGFWPFTGDKVVNLQDANMRKDINMGIAMEMFGGTVDEKVFNLYYEDTITKMAQNQEFSLFDRQPDTLNGSTWTRMSQEADQWSGVLAATDAYVAKYGNATLRGYLGGATAGDALRAISAGLQANGGSADSPFYAYVGNSGYALQPVPFGDMRISTQYYYDDGTPHATLPGGAAIDLASRNGASMNSAAYTTFDGYFDLTAHWGQGSSGSGNQMNLGWWNPEDQGAGTGYTAIFHGDALSSRYGHMLYDSAASQKLETLLDRASNAGMPKLRLPGGTQIGNISYTGYTIPSGVLGTHLHFDLYPNWWANRR